MPGSKSYITRNNKIKFNPQRKFLLFSSIDTNRSAHNIWLDNKDRNFDIALYVYEGKLEDNRVDFYINKKGSKFQCFFDFANNIDIYHYDAVWIVDHDIELATRDINEMFNIFTEYDLWLAQPSYNLRTPFSWEISVNDANYRLRYTNFVESGLVFMSKYALTTCLPIMEFIESGWGSDFIWPKILGFPDFKIAIIDEIQCYHPTYEPSIYFRLPNTAEHQDAYNLMKRFNAKYYTPRTLDGIKK